MKKQRPGGLAYYCIAIAVFSAAIYSWLDFLYKPIPKLAERGLGWTLGDLLFTWRSETYGEPVKGQLFVIAAIVLAIFAIILVSRPYNLFMRYIEESEAPVSILSTNIRIRMEDAGFALATVTRVQKIHANRSDVDAYHYSNTPNHGEIVPGSWSYKSLVGKENLSIAPLTRTVGKKFEVIERFKRPLPTSYRVTYLPSWLVLWLFDLRFRPWFKKVIVTRENAIQIKNEYSVDDPVFQLNCVRYPANHVDIGVDFPKATAPDPDEVQGFIIMDNVVEKIDVFQEGDRDRVIYGILLPKLKKQQTVRLQWSNRKMKAFVAQNLKS